MGAIDPWFLLDSFADDTERRNPDEGCVNGAPKLAEAVAPPRPLWTCLDDVTETATDREQKRMVSNGKRSDESLGRQGAQRRALVLSGGI